MTSLICKVLACTCLSVCSSPVFYLWCVALHWFFFKNSICSRYQEFWNHSSILDGVFHLSHESEDAIFCPYCCAGWHVFVIDSWSGQHNESYSCFLDTWQDKRHYAYDLVLFYCFIDSLLETEKRFLFSVIVKLSIENFTNQHTSEWRKILWICK